MTKRGSGRIFKLMQNPAGRFVGLFMLALGFQSQACGQQPTEMSVPGGKISITLPDEQIKVSQKELLNWIRSSAMAVSTFYGRFPVDHLTLKLHSGRGSGIRHGVTYPKDGGLILITVGESTELSDLKDDWVLTHEMTHLAFPSMAENHHWIEEGLATYIEPVARAQTGNLAVAEMWKQFVHDMPKGEPASNDQGLDNTPTWGRTYWGGAMFCLLADVKIRELTHNRKSLRDALRAIRDHHGIITEDWDIEKALDIGDKATGLTVLKDLYDEMRDKPDPVDLDELWKKLGISVKDRQVVFDDKAPDAAIRKGITSSSRAGK
jgi:hypothetical protein